MVGQLARWILRRYRSKLSKHATIAAPKPHAEAPPAAAHTAPHVAPPANLKKAFTDLLKPESGQGFLVAAPELVFLVMASFLNASLMLYKAGLMREFVTGQNLGQWRQWLKTLAKFPFVTLAMAILSQTTRYTQSRMSLLWRRVATRRLMKSYFSGMNYYRLLHHGKIKIDDPDVRMCSDVKAGCDALTGVFISGLTGFTMSALSSWALYSRRGLFAVFLPYLYSFVIVPVNLNLTKPDWSVISRAQKAYGYYQQLLTRTQLYGEGIAMLQGEKFEQAMLQHGAESWEDCERASWQELAKFEWFQHFISSFAMPGLWQTVASFGAAFIALKSAGPNRPVLDPREPNEAVVREYGANLEDFWQVFYGVRGASTLLMALETYKRCTPSLERVEQLQEAFALLHRQSSRAMSTTFVPDTVIEFNNVSVVTPDGVKLMAGLTFKVEPGSHLVICGHNGAGKSSIFRCLGGLWPVTKGTIRCPQHGGGIGGLHGAAYYLPQKPANIYGTLSDQLTYPVRVVGGMPEQELRRWLSYVGIEYLYDNAVQADQLNREMDWAVKLSLGEQQRLGIARILYHRPRFAILDECTSAVTKDMERWLFEVARKLGISCITITHRPALQDHHHHMLKLTGTFAEDGRGWELVKLDSELPPAMPHAETEAEVHDRIRKMHAESEQGAVSQSASKKNEDGLAKAGNLDDVHDASRKGCRDEEQSTSPLKRVISVLQLRNLDKRTQLRFVQLLACMIVRPQVAWEIYRTIGGSIALAMCNDSIGLLSELLINLIYAAGLTCLDRHIENLGRNLSLEVWRHLTARLHHEALDEAAFFRLSTDGYSKLANPMQRIADAKGLLDDIKRQLSATGGSVIQMLYFLPLLLRGGGGVPALALVGLYLMHFVVRTYWMPNFKAMTAKDTELEECFQVAQTRMRHVAEPIAFSGGGDMERLRVEEHFERLCDYRLQSLKQEFTYNFLTEFFIVYDNLPIWFHRMLSFNFAWRNVPVGGPSPASAVQNYLYDRTITVNLVGTQMLTAFPADWSRIDGRASRLLEVREALSKVQRVPFAPSENDNLIVRNLDLVTPKSRCLAKNISFHVDPGCALLVTGPNGCGKTALARVILGLWPSAGSSASIERPSSLLIVPQRPYLAAGSLGDQISYPHQFSSGTDEPRADMVLRAVGIGYLLDRWAPAGWTYRCSWEDVLSGGEQQRITLARALFHQPTYALLDECTSMIAVDSEEHLYKIVIEDFGITPLTFSQRLFLPRHHKSELHLGEDSTLQWSLETVST